MTEYLKKFLFFCLKCGIITLTVYIYEITKHDTAGSDSAVLDKSLGLLNNITKNLLINTIVVNKNLRLVNRDPR